MRILGRYVARVYLLTFGMSVLVFTFIMSIGSVIQAIDYLSRGVSGMVMLKFFFHSFPFILQFTIPMSVMTTVFLVTMRLSQDGEISAMKACGINLWQIVSPIILLSVLISFAAIYVSNFVSPASKLAQRKLRLQMADHDPLALLEEGRYVRDFPGHMIYIGRRRGAEVEDISIYVMDERTGQIQTNLRARRGTLRVDEERKLLIADLFEVRIERPDPNAPLDLARMRSMTAEHYPKRIRLDDFLRTGQLRRKATDYTILELMTAVREVPETHKLLKPQEQARERMVLLVEAHTRMYLSLSCFAFTLIGIPLGMTSKRRESSHGVWIILLLVFIFYAFMVFAKHLTRTPEWRPDLLLWIPILTMEVAGLVTIHRMR